MMILVPFLAARPCLDYNIAVIHHKFSLIDSYVEPNGLMDWVVIVAERFKNT